MAPIKKSGLVYDPIPCRQKKNVSVEFYALNESYLYIFSISLNNRDIKQYHYIKLYTFKRDYCGFPLKNQI